MRCPDCAKFVSVEETVEVNSEDVSACDGGGEVTAEIRLLLNCADCGTELAETYPEYSVEFEHECATPHDPGTEIEYEVEVEASETDRYDSLRHRRLKDDTVKEYHVPFRFQKHYYGAEVTAKVTCKACEEEIALDMVVVEEVASGFDSLV